MSTETKHSHHHNNMSQKRLRAVISIILSFLLSISLAGLTLLLVIEWSGFSRSSFYKNMSKNKYYDFVREDIYDDAHSATIPTGLPADVLKNIITSFRISQDVNGYIDAAFSGKTYNANTKEMDEKLKQNINDYFKAEGINPTAEQENNIQEYTASIDKIYMDTVKMPLLSAFVKARTFYHKIFPIGLIACLLFSAICILMIIKLHQWLHRSLRYITYSMTAAGLMTGILSIYILQSGFYRNINLSPQYFYNFFTDYVTNIFKSFVYFSAVWLVLSIIMISVIGIIKNSSSYHRH